MSKIALLLTLGMWTTLQGGDPAKAAPVPGKVTYAIVVNANNTVKETDETARATIKKLFLKDLSQWPDGTEARPYARESTAAEQVAFLAQVLSMKEAELARHWLRLKNMNGTTPPKEVDSDRLLLKYVAKHDGAFGIVKLAAAREATGIRILLQF